MQIRNVARNLLVSIAMVLVAPVSGYAANVVADGKEWRQVTETVNTSWNTLAASCDTGTGACGGAFDGWTWASQAEVTSLFQSFIGPAYTGGISVYFENDSIWAPTFTTIFTPTYDFPSQTRFVFGSTRDVPSDGGSYRYGSRIEDLLVPGNADYAFANTIFASSEDPNMGAWMYTTAAPIPEPEIYAMMGLGLGLMGWVGRRRKQQAA